MSQSTYVRSELNQYGEWTIYKMFTGTYFTKYLPSSTTHLKIGIVSKRAFHESLLDANRAIQIHIQRIRMAIESFDNDVSISDESELV